jgi:hypothetical protein
MGPNQAAGGNHVLDATHSLPIFFSESLNQEHPKGAPVLAEGCEQGVQVSQVGCGALVTSRRAIFRRLR